MFSIDVIDWSLALVNVAVLVALLVAGWFWAVSGLTKRLVL